MGSEPGKIWNFWPGWSAARAAPAAMMSANPADIIVLGLVIWCSR